jgi:hypothetical protein
LTAVYCSLAVLLGHVLGRQRVGIEANQALPPIARGAYWAMLVAVCYLFSESRAQFIYFQF